VIEVSWMAKLIVQQQDMSVATLAALRARGLTDISTVRLDFTYDAPGAAEAEQLADFLAMATDYDVEVTRTAKVGLRRRGWLVTGTTQQTHVTSEIINDWIRWMVLAGAKHGGCRFDGWGTYAPG
jgi:hypothetical protein